MNFLYGYAPQIIAGAWITLQVACCSLLLGLVLGLLGAAGESSSWRALRYVTTGIISLFRGLPELVVIYLIYFGGTLFLTHMLGHYVNVSAFVAGVFALSLIFASYSSQVFRGAFLAIPHAQLESARALGLSRWQIFQHILLPQAWRHALPGLGNLWLVLLKDTALISLIGLPDLMNKSQLAASATHQPFVFYVAAAFLYLLLTSASGGIMNRLTLRASRHLI